MGLAVAAVPLEALAASERVWVDAPGECPAKREIESALPALLRDHILTTVEDHEDAVEATVLDGGGSYEIRILGLSRRIVDRSRDCGNRARSAAVVIALALEPLSPMAEDESEAPVPASVSVERPRRAIPPTSQREVSGDQTNLLVGLGVALTFAPDGYGPTAGPRFGLLGRHGPLGVSVSGAIFPAQGIAAESGLSVSLMRIPSELSVRYGLPLVSGELSGALGCAFDVLAVGLESQPSQARLDVGPTLALGLAYRVGRFEPFVELEARWFPRDYRLVLRPDVELGSTPRLYVGFALGLRMRLL